MLPFFETLWFSSSQTVDHWIGLHENRSFDGKKKNIVSDEDFPQQNNPIQVLTPGLRMIMYDKLFPKSKLVFPCFPN